MMNSFRAAWYLIYTKTWHEKKLDLDVSGARFQSGRRMVINKGALTGLSFEIVECDKKHKLLVRADLLRRNLFLRV